MTNASSWASADAGEGRSQSLRAIQESLSVRLIQTDRADFCRCEPHEALLVVLDRNREDSFDHLPVMELRDGDRWTIVGVLQTHSIPEGALDNGHVRDHMQLLGESHLIGADASILAFVRDADRHPFRFVVSGREIEGLVSISDLQRLPVRAALFAMITQLEMAMAELIRKRLAESDALTALGNPDRDAKIREEMAKTKAADSFVNWVLHTQFCDKVSIIKKALLKTCTTTISKTRFENEMSRIQKLRDNLAHANQYAITREEAESVCSCVRNMDEWTERLSEWSSAPSDEALVCQEN